MALSDSSWAIGGATRLLANQLAIRTGLNVTVGRPIERAGIGVVLDDEVFSYLFGHDFPAIYAQFEASPRFAHDHPWKNLVGNMGVQAMSPENMWMSLPMMLAMPMMSGARGIRPGAAVGGMEAEAVAAAGSVESRLAAAARTGAIEPAAMASGTRSVVEPYQASSGGAAAYARRSPSLLGDIEESAGMLARHDAARAARRPPMTVAQEQMARSLIDEHPGLHMNVAEDAVQGASSVAGEGGGGADVRLLNGGGRELTVYDGAFSSRQVASRLQAKASQAGVTEIYMQINSGSREATIRAAHEIRGAYHELDQIFVRFYGAAGDVYWSGTFRAPR